MVIQWNIIIIIINKGELCNVALHVKDLDTFGTQVIIIVLYTSHVHMMRGNGRLANMSCFVVFK